MCWLSNFKTTWILFSCNPPFSPWLHSYSPPSLSQQNLQLELLFFFFNALGWFQSLPFFASHSLLRLLLQVCSLQHRCPRLCCVPDLSQKQAQHLPLPRGTAGSAQLSFLTLIVFNLLKNYFLSELSYTYCYFFNIVGLDAPEVLFPHITEGEKKVSAWQECAVTLVFTAIPQ